MQEAAQQIGQIMQTGQQAGMAPKDVLEATQKSIVDFL